MTRKNKKILGLLLTLTILLLAGVLVFFSTSRSGLDLRPELGRAPQVSGGDEFQNEPSSLKTMYRTVNLIQKHYIDSSRVDPRAMLLAATRALQSMVAEVLIREEGDRLIVVLGPDQKVFSLADVKSTWILLNRFREIYTFVQTNLENRDVDFQEVEYAAINGMLQTLDPHTSLLPPDIYRDMRDKTQGEFGGLGIVISIRDGLLTVVSPIDGTPAALAGLKSGDNVMKIGDTSTVNLALNDAVNLMRGKPGTAITLHIMRKGWEETRPFTIVRAIIQVRSVDSALLSGNVGYVRVKDFQGNTASDLSDHLAKLGEQDIRGLVLDLRNNPGGLLTAAVKVSDIFLRSGVIVTTAGQDPSMREVKRAVDTANEPDYPVVILVNSGSASASEIVAGALKNHDRALLVGERTFGKGSVQVLYDFMDGSALKMTTAQYLTPGDVSIQSVGVVPHVEIIPMRADEKMLELRFDGGYRESDLEHHFEKNSPAKVSVHKADVTLRYLWEEPKDTKGDSQSAPPDAEDSEEPAGSDLTEKLEPAKLERDFEISLARDLALQLATAKLGKVSIEAISGVLSAKAQTQEEKLVKTLRNLGIDWTKGQSDQATPNLSMHLAMDAANPIVAGQSGTLRVSVTNNGTQPLYRLHGTTRSDFRSLDDRELAFGKLSPGATITRTLEFKVPTDASVRTDDVRVSLDDMGKQDLPAAALRFSITSLPKPSFSHLAQLQDNTGTGDGDGSLQPGETVSLLVDVENVGAGPALKTFATLKSQSDNEIFLTQGRAELGEIKTGEHKQAIFAFEVKPTFVGEEARFEIALMDVDLRVYTIQKLTIPIRPKSNWTPLEPSVWAAISAADILEAPHQNAKVVAGATPGTTVTRIGTTADGAYAKISLGEDRSAWISAKAISATIPQELFPSPTLLINDSPKLVLDTLPSVVRDDQITVRGRATDDNSVRDVYVYVGDKKVFFSPNTNAESPDSLPFEARVTLEKGINYITVVAEENNQLDTREVITIRKDGSDGMPFVTQIVSGSPVELGVIPANRPPVSE